MRTSRTTIASDADSVTLAKMGITMTIRRWEEETYQRVLSDGKNRLVRASPPQPVDTLWIGREWHALHVALTGEETGGEPPAAYVLWTSVAPGLVSFTHARFTHPPALVREIHEWLGTVRLDRAVADLSAAEELGMFVYGRGRPDPTQDVVQSGTLESALDQVCRVYREAARLGHLLELLRG